MDMPVPEVNRKTIFPSAASILSFFFRSIIDRNVAQRWLVFLVFVPFFVVSSHLTQSHFLPKQLALTVVSVGLALWLATRRTLILPSLTVVFPMGFFIALSLLSGSVATSPRLALLQTCGHVSIMISFLAFVNFDRKTKRILLLCLLAAGAVQILWIAPLVFDDSWRDRVFDGEGKFFGSVGNSEFLATLLGCSLFAGVHLLRLARQRWHKVSLSLLVVTLVPPLLLTRNKGAFLIIFAYFSWRLLGWKRWLGLLICSLLVAICTLSPSGVMGRIFLWMTGCWMFLTHPFLGVGPGQLLNHYFETVGDLFSRFPVLAAFFGPHSASVKDAHNLIISSGLELGVFGVAVASALVLAGVRLCRPLRQPLRGGLAFLLAKSMYTVVLSSGVGGLLLALFLGILIPSRRVIHIHLAGLSRTVLLATAVVPTVVAGLWLTSDVWLKRGLRHLFFAENDQARSALQTAIKVNPESAEAWLMLGELEFVRRDVRAMDGALRSALAYQRDMDTYKRSAHMYYFRQQPEKAIPLYLAILKVYPQHLTSMARLAQCYDAMGIRASARSMATRLLETTPRVPSQSDLRNMQIAHNILDRFKPENDSRR